MPVSASQRSLNTPFPLQKRFSAPDMAVLKASFHRHGESHLGACLQDHASASSSSSCVLNSSDAPAMNTINTLLAKATSSQDE